MPYAPKWGQHERERENERSTITSTILQRFLKIVTTTTTVCFHRDGNVSLVALRLKIQVSKGTNILKRPLIIKDGIH
jgi:hypothetical protein